MFRYLLICSLLILSCAVNAQLDSGVLSFNNNRLLINSNGTMFNATDSTFVHEYPAGSGNHLLGFSGMWIGAKDGSGNLYTSINTGKDGADEFWPGPIDTLTGIAKNPSDWNKVWIVSKKLIDDHKASWNKTGYQTPKEIADWPARHADVNIKPHMAPYADANLNGYYDPESGDYPLIKGDVAAYFIANDSYGEHTQSGGLKLNIEMHGMSYAFTSGKDTNVLFNEYYLVNRSSIDFDTVLIGMFNDVVLGFVEDNYVGTMADIGTVFAYNGDSDDEGFYGNSRPVVAMVALDLPLRSSIAFSSSDASRKIPVVHEQFWNSLNSKWSDGLQLTFGATGREQSFNRTNWIYPQDTDPFNSGIWSEENSGNDPGIRNFLAVFGNQNLPAGAYIRLNTALIWDTNYDIQTLRNRITVLRKEHGQSLSAPATAKVSPVIWPNPAISGQNIHFDKNVTHVEIWDLKGKMLKVYNLDKNVEKQCSVSLPQGVYWIRTSVKDGFLWHKLVIQ